MMERKVMAVRRGVRRILVSVLVAEEEGEGRFAVPIGLLRDGKVEINW